MRKIKSTFLAVLLMAAFTTLWGGWANSIRFPRGIPLTLWSMKMDKSFV